MKSQKALEQINKYSEFDLLTRLPSLRELLKEYEQHNDSIHDSYSNDISISEDKIISFETETISKNKITFSYGKSKETVVTEIQYSHKTTKHVPDNLHKYHDSNPLSSCENPKNIVKKIQQIASMLKDYCKYKEVTVPQEITVEVMLQHFKVHSCMLYTLSTQLRQLPIYSCSMDKLDDLIASDYPKTALNDVIPQNLIGLIRQIINVNDILRGLFNLLRNSSFPITKFNNKQKITFLMMFAETISNKKKKNNKKKNKKKRNQKTGEKEESSEDEKGDQDWCKQMYDQIQNLSNEMFRCPISLSSQFLSSIKTKARKLL